MDCTLQFRAFAGNDTKVQQSVAKLSPTFVALTQIYRSLCRTRLKMDELDLRSSQLEMRSDTSCHVSSIQKDIADHKAQIDAADAFVASRRSLSEQDAENKRIMVACLRIMLGDATVAFSCILERYQKSMCDVSRFMTGFFGSQTPRASSFLDELDVSGPQEVGEASLAVEQLAAVDPFLMQRSADITRVNRTLQELQVVFEKIAAMTASQGEQIQRIDSDIENALANVESGHGELLKYLQDLQQSRTLIAKMTLVMVFCIAVFVLFFV